MAFGGGGFFGGGSDQSSKYTGTLGKADNLATDASGGGMPLVLNFQDNRQASGKYATIGGAMGDGGITVVQTDHGAIEGGMTAALAALATNRAVSDSAADVSKSAMKNMLDTGRRAFDFAERTNDEALRFADIAQDRAFDLVGDTTREGLGFAEQAMKYAEQARLDMKSGISAALTATQDFAEKAVAGDSARMTELVKWLVGSAVVISVAVAWRRAR